MKFRVALVTVLVAALTASLAVAAPAQKPFKTETTTETTTTTATTTTKPEPKHKFCHHRAAWVLRGALVSVAADQSSFTIDVKRVKWHAWLHEGKTVTVQVDENTRIWRLGEKVTLDKLTVGDRLIVQTRRCKSATATLLAVRVVAKPAKQVVCRPQATRVLRGALTSVATDLTSFTLDVKWVNWHPKWSRDKTATVRVDETTRIWRLGEKVTLDKLTLGDRLIVQTRLCKAGPGTTATLLAVRAVAWPAKVAPPTTTTTTTTSG